MTIAITGHRPNKLGNDYTYTSPLFKAITYQLQQIINRYEPKRLITGMALGIDQVFAQLAISNNTPFTAAIPCYDQDSNWPNISRSRYSDLINNPLCTKHLVTETYYNNWCMQIRNEWIVNQLTNDDKLIAVWDGSSGGTKNCYDYALNKIGEHNILRINPKELTT